MEFYLQSQVSKARLYLIFAGILWAGRSFPFLNVSLIREFLNDDM